MLPVSYTHLDVYKRQPLVHVYRYVTEGTFDAYLWQTVENKQKFISQIMTSKDVYKRQIPVRLRH